METFNFVKNSMLGFFMAAMSILVVLSLIRAILGPKVTDRIVATNMIGTMVMVMISILAVRLDESYLVDACLIYAMVSFLAVIVLSKVYIGVYNVKKGKGKEEKKDAV